MSYKYKNPLNDGYTKVPNRKYKTIIRNHKWYEKYKVYENDKSYLIHQFEPMYRVILNIVLLPVWFILYGILGMREVFCELYSVIFQKRAGSFLSSIVWKDELRQKSINNTLSKIK